MGGSRGDAGQLCCLRIGHVCADGEPGGATLLWEGEQELPIFAVAATPPVAASGAASSSAPAPIVAAAAGSIVVLYEAASGVVLRQLSAGRDGVLYALAFSPSGGCLLASGSEELVHAFNIPAGTRRAVVRLTRSGWAGGLNTATVNALCFIDEAGFVSGGYDATITRWTLEPPRDQPPAVELDLEEFSIEELRDLIERGGLSSEGLVEKSHLIERANEALRRLARSERRPLPAYHAQE